MAGRLVIFSGPSGTGKSTIVKHILGIKKFELSFSVSACSRSKRPGEVEGKDYYFLTLDEFKTKIEENEFLEWEEVYGNHYYGTLKGEVEKLRLKNNVIFDVDVVGGINIKRQYKDTSISIFVEPPSIEELGKRLRDRKTESEESIKKRIRKANMELRYASRYDHVIKNDKLDDALAETEKLVADFLLK